MVQTERRDRSVSIPAVPSGSEHPAISRDVAGRESSDDAVGAPPLRKIVYFRAPGLPAALPPNEVSTEVSSEQRKTDKRFYASAAWIALRDRKRRKNPLCERCESKGITKAMAHVHHKVDRKADARQALDFANLQSLCLRCHSEVTKRAGLHS